MTLRRVLAVLVVVLLIAAGAGYVQLQPLLRTMPIGAAYAAKAVCSGVFLSGRDKADIVANDLMSIPFVTADSIVVDEGAGTVDATLLLSTVRAIYRENCGCTLVVGGVTEDELRAQHTSPAMPRPEPSEDQLWPEGAKVAAGEDPRVDFAKLDAALDYALDEPYPDKKRGTRAVVVVHDGRIIAERYAEGYHADMPLTSWSMTKTVTGVLGGILAGRGQFDLHAPAPVREWRGEGDPRGAITIDQLMRMSSGLKFLEEYGATPSDVVIMLHEQASAGTYAASFPLETEPDTKWYYSSGTTNILARIQREAIGGGFDDYLRFPRAELFDKLGMRSPVMELDPAGVFVGSSYLYCTARDWARFGLFLMQDGVWNGERILPEGWVDYLLTPTPGAPKGEYGGQIWLNAGNPPGSENRDLPGVPVDAFYLSGFEGQRVIVVPSRKTVVVRMGLTQDPTAISYNDLMTMVLDALPAE